MAEVDIAVAGRTYRIGCADGQEAHLRALAAGLDAEARAIAAQAPLLGEGRLLVMAALIIADRLSETEARLRDSEAAIAARPAPRPDERLMGDGAALDAALGRLEAMIAAHDDRR
jgi:cell division protein ZapA